MTAAISSAKYWPSIAAFTHALSVAAAISAPATAAWSSVEGPLSSMFLATTVTTISTTTAATPSAIRSGHGVADSGVVGAARTGVGLEPATTSVVPTKRGAPHRVQKRTPCRRSVPHAVQNLATCADPAVDAGAGGAVGDATGDAAGCHSAARRRCSRTSRHTSAPTRTGIAKRMTGNR